MQSTSLENTSSIDITTVETSIEAIKVVSNLHQVESGLFQKIQSEIDAFCVKSLYDNLSKNIDK